MAYRGKYQPTFPKKYRGDVKNIIYRSLWERKFCTYCDKNENILEWAVEEIIIPYRSPSDGRIHRYFPDFYVKLKESNGKVKKYIIEIKPKKQTIKPKAPKRQNKSYLREVYEYAKNMSKWKAAEEWCLDRGYEFKILTENDLYNE
jgi:hypothetical protein